jgi:hypothetical protein
MRETSRKKKDTRRERIVAPAGSHYLDDRIALHFYALPHLYYFVLFFTSLGARPAFLPSDAPRRPPWAAGRALCCSHRCRRSRPRPGTAARGPRPAGPPSPRDRIGQGGAPPGPRRGEGAGRLVEPPAAWSAPQMRPAQSRPPVVVAPPRARRRPLAAAEALAAAASGSTEDEVRPPLAAPHSSSAPGTGLEPTHLVAIYAQLSARRYHRHEPDPEALLPLGRRPAGPGPGARPGARLRRVRRHRRRPAVHRLRSLRPIPRPRPRCGPGSRPRGSGSGSPRRPAGCSPRPNRDKRPKRQSPAIGPSRA